MTKIPGVDVCPTAGGDVALGTVTPGRVWWTGVEDPVTGGLLGVVPMTTGALATAAIVAGTPRST
ncbi:MULTISPECIES: hypothetical protein [unclassified Ornithinimicrobium]|uniref:hypothetical protein n=1 Tax=unclassified Ornithinimicrobium TaxID=2615080 RepID=UPI00385408F9